MRVLRGSAASVAADDDGCIDQQALDPVPAHPVPGSIKVAA